MSAKQHPSMYTSHNGALVSVDSGIPLFFQFFALPRGRVKEQPGLLFLLFSLILCYQKFIVAPGTEMWMARQGVVLGSCLWWMEGQKWRLSWRVQQHNGVVNPGSVPV